jgi:hypothetical protein
MISVCVPFYPWYREYDRSHEVFDVLVKGLNKVKGAEELELCLTDGGVEDIWARRSEKGRSWDAVTFKKRLKKEFKGKLNYSLAGALVHTSDNGNKRFWLVQGVIRSVRRASYENLLIFGIDCYAPEDLVERYSSIVKPGTAWVPLSYNVPQGAPLAITGGPGRCWHTARGIVGIKRQDYKAVGGYEGSLPLISTQSDSNFYMRMVEKMEIVMRKEEGLFHVNHPGSNANKKWKLEDGEK